MEQLTAIFKSDKQELWFVSIKEIPGCHSQGKSLEQARERIEEALTLFRENTINI